MCPNRRRRCHVFWNRERSLTSLEGIVFASYCLSLLYVHYFLFISFLAPWLLKVSSITVYHFKIREDSVKDLINFSCHCKFLVGVVKHAFYWCIRCVGCRIWFVMLILISSLAITSANSIYLIWLRYLIINLKLVLTDHYHLWLAESCFLFL